MLLIPIVGILMYQLHKRFMYKQFNGVTGDLLGTFVLLSELAMILTGIVINIF
jgi:cobalamin synthase